MSGSEKGSPREQANQKDKEDANAISFAISKAKPNAISKKPNHMPNQISNGSC